MRDPGWTPTVSRLRYARAPCSRPIREVLGRRGHRSTGVGVRLERPAGAATGSHKAASTGCSITAMASDYRPRGIFVPVVTPFGADGKVDFDSLESLTDEV